MNHEHHGYPSGPRKDCLALSLMLFVMELQDKDIHQVCWIFSAGAKEPRGFGSGGLALICRVSTVYIRTLIQPASGEIWEKGGRDYQKERERARKVTTTEHGAHKFSCASAGTAVPLWTSSVLQYKSLPSNNNTYKIKADCSKQNHFSWVQ